MSDVVAVGLITAGSSLIAATVGAITTYKVAQRSKDTAIATAESQNTVELAKIEAENKRLRAGHAEEERRNRQGTYHRTLTVLQNIYGADPGIEDFTELNPEWVHCLAGVQIFGSSEASSALEEVRLVLERRPTDGVGMDAWEQEFVNVTMDFIKTVRTDIGPTAATDSLL